MTNQYGADSVFNVKSQKGFRAKMALLDAGIELIAESGIYGFSVGDLCKKAGLKRTSFYSYFDTVEQFLCELSTRENTNFEADFHTRHGEAYTQMQPGPKRMVLTLLQYFEIVNTDSVWNRFVVKLCSQHAPTSSLMLADLKADILSGIESGDFQISSEEANTYAHLIVASLSIGSQQFENPVHVNGRCLIEMLLEAGKVKNKYDLMSFSSD